MPTASSGEFESDFGGHLAYGTITIKPQPWVPTKVVSEAYRGLQRQVLGRKPRALSSRTLAVSKFVIKHMRNLITFGEEWDEAQDPTWASLIERWNQENPNQLYYYESQFERDLYRATDAVSWPFDTSAAELTEPLWIPAWTPPSSSKDEGVGHPSDLA